MAASSVALSTMRALGILKAGGNATDAAIAANACENVVEPMMNGMGGDLMAMIWNQKKKKVYGYNGPGNIALPYHNYTASCAHTLSQGDHQRVGLTSRWQTV
jgi:gamma-glutamyltranspeptidase